MRHLYETYEQIRERLHEQQRAQREKHKDRISASRKKYNARPDVKERNRIRRRGWRMKE